MSASHSSDFTEIERPVNNYSEKQSRPHSLNLGENIDELILRFGKELVTDCSNHGVCETLCQLLQFRAKNLHSQEDMSVDLLTACRYLTFNLTSSSMLHFISEHNNHVLVENILELSFEILIVVGKDESCLDFIQSFLKILESEDQFEQLSKTQAPLIAFECFLSALVSVTDKQKVNLPKSQAILSSLNFLTKTRDLVINFVDHNVSSFVLNALVPKLIKFTNTHSVVNMLWAELKSDLSSKHISFPMKLFVLCGLAEFLIENKDGVSIIESFEFWKLIQEGLVSVDTLVRKQALYLLKRAIDTLALLNMSLEVKIFSWNPLKSDKLQKTWWKIFMLFEVLEEKQSHLVIPVMQSLLQSTDILSNIHPSWLVAGYTRILSHDTLQVIKLGVINFLQLDIDFHSRASCAGIPVIETLFQKLNNMLIYNDNSYIVDWSRIDISLRTWFARMASHPQLSGELIPVVINAMAKVQWCAIPLFHLLFNLSLAPLSKSLRDTDLTVLSGFLKEAIKTQNIFIRGAVQCVILSIAAKGIKNTVNIMEVVNFLSIFRQNECFKRGLKSWEIAKEWVSTLLIIDDEITKLLFNEKNLSIDSKARSLVLFVDSGLINPKETKFQEALREYFCVLEDTSKRPYASSEKSDSCLKWIFHILEELSSSKSYQQSESLLNILSPYLKEAIFYIEKRLLEVDQITNFEIIELYINVLQVISDMGYVSYGDAVNLSKISKEISLEQKNHPVQQLLALKITVWFIEFGSYQKEKMHAFEQVRDHCLLMLKNGHLQLKISKRSDDSLSRNHQVLWGRLLSGYVWALWSVLQECLDRNIVTKEETLSLIPADDVVQLATDSIESGGRESLVPVLKVLRNIFLEALPNYSLCQKFLQFSWNCCFELRKTALFWPAIKSWIELAFSKINISTVEMRSIVENFSEKILNEGEAVNGLSNIFLSHLCLELMDVVSVKPLLSLLTKALVFGQVPRKDQRIEDDTYTLIRELGSDLAVNDLIPQPGYGNSQQVRLGALSVLLGVCRQEGGTDVVVSAVKQLMEMDRQLTAKRQRYHGDSLHHRIKHRILQAVLVLHQVLCESSEPLAKSCLVDLVKWSSVGLQGGSQQPSVRYQLEWLLCRVLLSSPQLLASFWTLFNESSEERAGSVCSFISVAYHLASTLRDAEFTERCVSEVLPWCMAQQFNIRLYAQVVLDKLWPLDPEVASKYTVVRSSLSKSLKLGNTMRNVDKLKSDFYFTTFHPLRHFTLETIFKELPRLSNMSRDEWIPLSTIKDSLSNYDPFLPLENPDDSLTHFTPPSWVAKASAEPEVEVEAVAMQKKFVPWRSMFPEAESSSSRSQLVVVASLIDKLPNLGGLTRTCEIFAAESLVVPSLEFTKDKVFSTLSMTAEKHVNIVEVKPYDLPQYLREKKKSGYTLVGAEQTASSVSLQSYKFPRKSLLLLGNEKEGVPVNLLPLLDVCVEVPQLGVVRSLNVHVTGALFVWEYTKQHLHSS